MKRKGIFALLIALPLLLTSCDDFGHVHNWSPYLDNGDGTHYRMCCKDSRHIETSEHNYVEEVLVEATDTTPGKIFKKCKDCGHEEEVRVNPTGQHIYDQEVVSEKYLAEKTSDYSSIYYKSSTDGAYGDDSKLFEKTLLPEGYSNIEYLQGSGTEFIDTGIERTENTTISYNSCKRGNGRLPYDYQEVEYIEFTGTQWIDTGINGDATWDFSLQWTQTQERQLMGYGGSGGEYFGVNNGYYAIYQVSETPIGNKDEVKFMYEGMNGALYVNGTRAVNGGYEAGASNKTFAVGSLHGKAFCQFKLYSLVVTKAGNKVAEFVPCYNTESGKIGLYDLVTCEFFGNSGTGIFLKGNDINPGSRLPDEYQEVEYLEATGTQYIDTGISAVGGIETKFGAEWTTGNDYLVGSHGDAPNYNRNGAYLTNEHNWEFGYGDTYHRFGEGENNVYYDVEFSTLPYNAYLKVNESLLCTLSGQELTTELNIWLFGSQYSKNTYDVYSAGRLYYVKIYKDGILVRDFVPCYKKQNDEAGMFDLVDSIFFGNNGTGEFEVGPVINNINTLPARYEEVDFLNIYEVNAGEVAEINRFEINNIKYNSISTTLLRVGTGINGVIPIGSRGVWYADLAYGTANNVQATPSLINENVWTSVVYTLESEQDSLFIGSWGDSTNYWSAQTTSYKTVYCYLEGVETAKLVPCLDTNTGKVGFYEMYSGSFYENLGTGTVTSSFNKVKKDIEPQKENVKVGYRYIGEEPSYFYGRIYDATIYNGNTVVQKFIPALRNSDSAVGVYDLIGGKFYEQTGNFKNSGVVGHHLDKGVITKQPTLDEEGEMTYTCSICGAQIHKKISRLAYKVNFSYDEGIKEIRVHYDDDPSHYEVSNFAYTRNPFSFNYSSTNASVWFEVVCIDGYELDKVEVPFLSCLHTSKEGIEYLLLIQSDLEVNIASKQIANE